MLHLPSGLTTDSNHRVFVADPGAKTVHIFDFVHSKYSRLDPGGDHLGAPVALAEDRGDNLYVTDRTSRTLFIYDSTGKFRGELGKLRGGESYFDSLAALAIDRTTGRLYVCDRCRHMVIIMDSRGRLLGKIGKRDHQGNIYVSDPVLNQIHVFGHEGQPAVHD